MPSKVTAYKCDWCHRCFGRHVNANGHEAACKNNPARKDCRTCIHSAIRTIGWTTDPFGDPTVERFGPFCDHHNRPIHEQPYFIDCEMYQPEHHSDIPVPYTCNAYEYKGYAGYDAKEE